MPLNIQNYEIHTDLKHNEVRLRFVSGKSHISFPAHQVVVWCHLGSSEAECYATLTADVLDEHETYVDAMFFRIDLNEDEMKQIMEAYPFLYITYSSDHENPYETPRNYFLRKLVNPETIEHFAKALDEWDCFYIMGKSYSRGHYDTWYESMDHGLDVLPEGSSHDLHRAFAAHTIREQIRKHIHID